MSYPTGGSDQFAESIKARMVERRMPPRPPVADVQRFPEPDDQPDPRAQWNEIDGVWELWDDTTQDWVDLGVPLASAGRVVKTPAPDRVVTPPAPRRPPPPALARHASPLPAPPALPPPPLPLPPASVVDEPPLPPPPVPGPPAPALDEVPFPPPSPPDPAPPRLADPPPRADPAPPRLADPAPPPPPVTANVPGGVRALPAIEESVPSVARSSGGPIQSSLPEDAGGQQPWMKPDPYAQWDATEKIWRVWDRETAAWVPWSP